MLDVAIDSLDVALNFFFYKALDYLDFLDIDLDLLNVALDLLDLGIYMPLTC